MNGPSIFRGGTSRGETRVHRYTNRGVHFRYEGWMIDEGGTFAGGAKRMGIYLVYNRFVAG